MLTCSSCRSHRASCFSSTQCFDIFSRANRWLPRSFPLKTFHFFHRLWVHVQNSVPVHVQNSVPVRCIRKWNMCSDMSVRWCKEHFSFQYTAARLYSIFLRVEDSCLPSCSPNNFSTFKLQFSTFICRNVHSAIKFVITSCPTFPNSFAATRQQFWFMAERWIYWLPRFGTQNYETLWCDKKICISYFKSIIMNKIFIS